MDTNQNQSKKIMQQNIAEVWLYFDWSQFTSLSSFATPILMGHVTHSSHYIRSSQLMKWQTEWQTARLCSGTDSKHWREWLPGVQPRSSLLTQSAESSLNFRYFTHSAQPITPSLAGYLPHTVSTLKSPSPTQQNNYLIAFSWTKVTFLSYIHNVHSILQAGLMM